ncbi:MAG: hypothetical protein FD152_482 [Xanthobacteraceae bacterium]|nr:MAG: hypothetical protein FD152_482 [Xanthobacteraceae bacterium]
MTTADIQRALVALGYNIGNTGPKKDGVDGMLGGRTSAALKAFQASRGLAQTGMPNALTLIALAAPRPSLGPEQNATVKPVKPLPAKYAYLLSDASALPMLREAVRLHGVYEKAGPGSNPEILSWAREVGLGSTYTDDATAWCGLFAAVVAKRAGYPLVSSPLWARNWLNFGTPVASPELGDILVFPRGTGGHVAIYVGEDATHYHMLGGNQSDQVNIMRRAKKPFLGARRPNFQDREPSARRVVRLTATGPVSTNEA